MRQSHISPKYRGEMGTTEVTRHNDPILTIAIPTFNRAKYLDRLIRAFHNEYCNIEDRSRVEFLVFDNCSCDSTREVVSHANRFEQWINYHCHVKNMGSDVNIATCIGSGKGKYCWVFSDDDLIVPGSLNIILSLLESGDYGLVLLRPFRFKYNLTIFRTPKKIRSHVIQNSPDFLKQAPELLTLISACIFKRNPDDFQLASAHIKSGLTQLPVNLRAVRRGTANLLVDTPLVGYRVNNSGGYDPGVIFIINLLEISTSAINHHSDLPGIRALKRALLLKFYPLLLFRIILRSNLSEVVLRGLANTYESSLFYKWGIRPALKAPRPLALTLLFPAVIFSVVVSGRIGRLPRYLLSLFI